MASARFGSKTLASTSLSLLILLVAFLAIRPRFLDGRLRLPHHHVLTSTEVQSLPVGVIPVVLGRGLGDTADDFESKLLQMVMERSGLPFAFGLTSEHISQDAAIEALASGASFGEKNPYAITVGSFGAGPSLSAKLRAVPVPISGGLLGLRAGWTHKDKLPELKSIGNLRDLRSITLLQGHGWSELDIFDAAGLRTYETNANNMIRLINTKRVDLLPQGIAELQSEEPIVKAVSENIVIDPSLLIVYPHAVFFYVSPGNDRLAGAIQKGFDEIIADGSYQKLLESDVYTPWLREHLALSERRVIFVPNPDAVRGLDAVEPRYWIVPWSQFADGEITNGSQLCEFAALRGLCE